MTEQTSPGAGELLAVDAHLRLTTAVERLAGHLDRVKAAPPMQPVFANPADVAIAAGGLALVDLGGPDMGHYWYVRNVVVGGVSARTVAAGVADVYVSSAELGGPAGTQEPPLPSWRDGFAALPASRFYGTEELVVRAGEHLVVRFSTATNTQQYAAAARVTDFQEAPSQQAWGL